MSDESQVVEFTPKTLVFERKAEKSGEKVWQAPLIMANPTTQDVHFQIRSTHPEQFLVSFRECHD